MSDNESSDNKVKPAIFYAQKSQQPESKRPSGKRDFEKKRSRSSQGGYGKSSSDKPRSDNRFSNSRRADDSRVETFGRSSSGKSPSDKPRSERPRSDSYRRKGIGSETFKPRYQDESLEESGSPWKNRLQKSEQLATLDVENHATIDHQQIKKQRKEETIIYSENSCKAVFANRPDAIVKAFLLQEKTYEFKALVAYLVKHRLGYDVITDEQMTKIAQTPHHGGVCLIVKKRQAQSVGDYLLEVTSSTEDCVLAIDDINNPHNLGGIARTAAFFNVNGLMLRRPEILDNGAAMRVAEGGVESLNLIKADDLVSSIDLFKQQGYQVITILPCKVNSLKAEALSNVTIKNKTVIIVFQQINTQLAGLADDVVYLPGSDMMSALNISVLTGIVLAKWQDSSKA